MPHCTTHRWSLAYPEGWDAWRDGERYVLFQDPRPIGRLEILVLAADNARRGELPGLVAEHRDAGRTLVPATFGSLQGWQVAYRDAGEWCREWILTAGDLAVFVSYACDPQDRGREDATCEAILASFATAD